MDIKHDAKNKNNSRQINYNIKNLSSAKKNEHLKALMKLQQEEYIIEKTVSSHLENAKIDPKIIQNIQRDHLNYTNERQTFLNSLQYSVKEIKESWNDIKNEINDVNNFGNLDVDRYKTKLHKLSEKIQEFYKNEFIYSLKEDESSLDLKLIEFNLTLNRYENFEFSSSLLSKNQHRTNSINLQDFEEVANFSSLVAKTGHTQNWNNEDHLLFLKLRKKYKTIPALVNAIQGKCPDLSTKCIVNHEAWYKFYLKLLEQQKSVIKDWRQQKEFERTIRIEKNEFYNIPDNVNETKNFEKISEKPAKENANKPENQKANKTRELIKRWREEKENDRLMHEEQIKLKEQSKQFAENRRKTRAQRSKLAVTEYKKRRNLKTHLVSKSNEENIFKSADLIKSFREQDNYYIQKRKRILTSKRENNSLELKKEEKLSTSISASTGIRVSTLLNSTKVWTEKSKNCTRAQNQELLYIKDLPKMSIGRRNIESL